MSPAHNPVPITALQEHEPFVRALALSLLGEDSARDAVQDTWVAALQHAPTPLRSPRAWLARVTRNLSRNHRRSEARRTRREQLAARPEAVESVEAVHARVLIQREVVEAVVALREPYKTAIVLRYYEGLTPAQIASRLDVPAGTVRSQVSRGLELLRDQLDATVEGGRARWGLMLAPLVHSVPRALAVSTSVVPLAVVGSVVIAAGVAFPLWLQGQADPAVSPQIILTETAPTVPVAMGPLIDPPVAPRLSDPGAAAAVGPITREAITATTGQEAPVDLDEMAPRELIRLAVSLRPLVDERLLTPAPRWYEEYEALLEYPRTGLARILTVGRFQYAISKRGGGAFYSFATRDNSYDREPDIKLEQRHFSSGFSGSAQGFVLDVGVQSLKDLTESGTPPDGLDPTKLAAWRFLWETVPEEAPDPDRPTYVRFNHEQRQRAHDLGLSSAKVHIGHTYVLHAYIQEQHDHVVGFQVIGEDEYGLTLAWRILDARPMRGTRGRRPESPEPPAAPDWAERMSTGALLETLGRIREECNERFMRIPERLAREQHEAASRSGWGLARLLDGARVRNVVSLNGGGAFYSFGTGSNDYEAEPDLGLSSGLFSAGFYGADFGFVMDLGECSIEELVPSASASAAPAHLEEREREAWRFLWTVRATKQDADPPRAMRLGDEDRARARELGVDMGVGAVPGHSYLVRSSHWGGDDHVVAVQCLEEDDFGVFILWCVLEKRTNR